MSGVSVRTLHFYDEMALLKPAYTKANGYRIYEEPQLLMLQQILFYRELGFELKRIKEILSQRKFEKVAARSEEHTSELQSRPHLVCRLLLEKKKDTRISVPPLKPRRQVSACYR